LQQLPIGYPCVRTLDGTAKLLDDCVDLAGCHQTPSLADVAGPLLTVSRSGAFFYTFFWGLARSPAACASSPLSAECRWCPEEPKDRVRRTGSGHQRRGGPARR